MQVENLFPRPEMPAGQFRLSGIPEAEFFHVPVPILGIITGN